MSQVIAVATGLLVRDSKVLCVHGEGIGWHFPGGKIEKDENPTAAVVRELKEETDLDTRVVSYIEKIEVPWYKEPDKTLCIHTFQMACLDDTQLTRATGEVTGVNWLSAMECLIHMTRPSLGRWPSSTWRYLFETMGLR